MNGNKAVLDSNAIIYASNGTIDAEILLSGKESYFASIITFTEVYSYEFTKPAEKKAIDDILDNLEIINLNGNIADQAIAYRKNKQKKIKLPDAVILATAKVLGAELITDNLADFQGIESSVMITGISDMRT